jgi:hypothetical protein
MAKDNLGREISCHCMWGGALTEKKIIQFLSPDIPNNMSRLD